MPPTIHRLSFLNVVRAKIEDYGGNQAAAAREFFHCSGAYLSDVLKGKRDPGPKILAPLGYVAVDTPQQYRKTNGKKKP